MSQPRESLREMSFASDLRVLVEILWTRVWWVAAVTGAALLLGAIYLLVTPRSYTAQSVIQIEQEEQKVVKFEGITSEDLKSLEVLNTYEQNVVSSEVLLRVIHGHGLLDDPEFLPEVKNRADDNELQEKLALHIHAKIRRGTRLIDIQVEHRRPALAQRIAQLLVEEFIAWNTEAQRQVGKTAGRFLVEESERLKTRLTQAEQALQAYREQHQAVSLEDKQNITLERLRDLNARVTVSKSERLKIEADSAQLSKAAIHTPGELLSIPSIANAPAVAELRRSLGEKEARLATLSERYKPEHPKYVEAKTDFDNGQKALDEAIMKVADVLASQYQAAVLNERKLEEALGEQQTLALGLDQLSIGYAGLAREVESDRVLYESVLARLKETDITKDLTHQAVRVVARPLVPSRPSKPRKSLTLALSLIAGFTAGCGLAFASHAADRSLRTLQDAETRLGLRSLGEIPKLPATADRLERPPVLADSEYAASESFRTLRTSLSMLSDDPNRRSFLFTSAHPGEGKTFCALNCAAAFARLGLKTLLIDADFRVGQLERILFPAAAPATGPTPATWQEAVRATPYAQLSLLAPQAATGEGEFVAGQTLEHILPAALAQFERVVIDTAPVLIVSDTLLFARFAHAVCLVIEAGRTPAEDVLRAVQRLATAGAPVAGFVWNQVKPTRQNAYERAYHAPYGSGRTRISRPVLEAPAHSADHHGGNSASEHVP